MSKNTQQINELREEFNKRLDVIVNDIENQQKEPQGVWQPKDGEGVYCVLRDGKVICVNYIDCSTYENELNQGGMFETEAEAKLEANKRIVTQNLRVLAGGFKPDFDNVGESKLHINYNHYEERFVVLRDTNYQTQGVIYFETREAAQHAVDTLGDELLCLFDVEKS